MQQKKIDTKDYTIILYSSQIKKRSLHFIVDKKVKIIHFHDKTNLGDLQFYIIVYVVNTNRSLYILVLILPELVIDCFEL